MEHSFRRTDLVDQLFEIFGVDPRTFHPSFEAYLAMVHPDDVGLIKERVSSALEAGGSFESQGRICRPDGTTRVLMSRGRIMSDAFGQPERLIGACMDVTQYSQTIERLNTSEARYRAMVDHASDGMVLHNERGEILDVNTRVCSQLSYTREELIGQTPRLYNPEMTPERLLAISDQLHDAEFVTFETEHTDKTGAHFPRRSTPAELSGKRSAPRRLADTGHHAAPPGRGRTPDQRTTSAPVVEQR